MKRFLLIVLVVGTLFSMVACSTGKPRATIAETGEPISDEPGEFWLPPEDFLTEEEKEFRSQVIEAAGLDENSPDFEEQLIKLYTATDSSEYPNYDTYKLFIDRASNK